MRAEFHIQGMGGGPGADEVRKALEETAGVSRVTFSGKTAVVEFDDRVVQQSTLIKRLQDLGLQATVGDQQQGAQQNG